ncbi:MAG TPA: hypothetical protein VNM92_02950 [Thermoanaerobaculia bacterium]|nr:hypothetical protein [Thermoanaerobaculia bacterium]
MTVLPADSATSQRQSLWREVAKDLFVFLVYLTLAIQATWPLARGLSTWISDAGDPFLNTWILDWVMHAAVTPSASIWQAPIFHPSRFALAMSENLFGIALVMAPFRALGLSPLEIYNVAILLGFAFSAYGGFVLCRLMVRSLVPAMIGGFLYGFALIRFSHLPHLQHVWGGWLPVLLAALVHYQRRPGWKRALLFGAALFMNGLTNVHWFLFGSVTAALTLLLMIVFDRDGIRIRRWTPLILAGGFSLLCMIPVLQPYRTVSKLYGMKRDKSETRFYSATWRDWLVAPDYSRHYGDLSAIEARHAERQLFPGFMTLLLAAAGTLLAATPALRPATTAHSPPSTKLLKTLDVLIVALAILSYFGAVSRHGQSGEDDRFFSLVSGSVPFVLALILLVWRLSLRFPLGWGGDERRSLRTTLERANKPLGLWLSLLWTVVGVVGSLGLNAFFHSSLFSLSVFRSLRAPSRWAFIACIGLSVLSAYGALALTRRWKTRSTQLVIGGLLGLLCWVDLQEDLGWTRVHPATPAVYQWLADAPIRGAVLELPMDSWLTFEFLLRATTHHRPLVNGTSGFETPLHHELRGMTSADPIPAGLVSRLEAISCSLLIIHANLMPQHGLLQWLKGEIRSGRLAFVRRFDHDISGDYVFAITRVEPEWIRLAGSETADAAGQSPQQNLERFLSATGEVYNSIPFGLLEKPQNGAELRGPLTVYGWAFAPAGVASVNILFEAGRVSVPAVLEERAEITARFPWYPKTPKPGFLLEMKRRPKGVSADTDVQVEVVDNDGRKTYLRGAFIRWFR